MDNWIIRNIKARLSAKPFNIYTEEIDYKRDGYDWLAGDGKLYYGKRWFVFFESHQNSWWKNSPNNQLNQQ